jgi:hypothetical protein
MTAQESVVKVTVDLKKWATLFLAFLECLLLEPSHHAVRKPKLVCIKQHTEKSSWEVSHSITCRHVSEDVSERFQPRHPAVPGPRYHFPAAPSPNSWPSQPMRLIIRLSCSTELQGDLLCSSINWSGNPGTDVYPLTSTLLGVSRGRRALIAQGWGGIYQWKHWSVNIHSLLPPRLLRWPLLQNTQICSEYFVVLIKMMHKNEV